MYIYVSDELEQVKLKHKTEGYLLLHDYGFNVILFKTLSVEYVT